MLHLCLECVTVPGPRGALGWWSWRVLPPLSRWKPARESEAWASPSSVEWDRLSHQVSGCEVAHRSHAVCKSKLRCVQRYAADFKHFIEKTNVIYLTDSFSIDYLLKDNILDLLGEI